MLKPETKTIQEKLANFTRDGKKVEIEGVREDRVYQYRRLVFNIQLNTMEQAFPITHSIMEPDEWKGLVQDFFVKHDCQTTQIWKLPYEFYIFIKDKGYAKKLGRPYLNDLLLFEWIEIDVHTMPDIPIPDHVKDGDVLKDIIILNPEFKLNKLIYPVHMKKAEELKALKGDYFLLSYREQETGRVHFMNLSMFHTYIFEQLTFAKKSLDTILNEAAEAFQVERTRIEQEGVDFVKQLFEKKIAVGYKG